jgi:nucleotide-binding universal stress UspA family protein
MQTFKRALVALDLSDVDKSVLQFIGQQAEALGIQKLYLLHIIPDFAMPKQVDTAFQQKFSPDIPVDERVSKRLEKELEEAFGSEPSVQWEIEVREGKPYEKLLHWIKVKQIDLLVVGKKSISEGSGITAKRVARNAGCSVLFVPKIKTATTRQLVVPNDFSKHSAKAIHTAVHLGRQIGGVPVHSLHIVDLPPEDYYNRAEPGQGYRGLLMESAKKAGQDFLKEQQLRDEDIVEVYRENFTNSVPRHIIEYAEEQAGALIVMGAKGHSPFETFLFGSVTEKLAEGVEAQPLLVIR